MIARGWITMDVRPRSHHAEDGAAATEFAIILPLLLILVVGILEFGFVFNAQISLTQAVRESVRVGAVGTAPTTAKMGDRLDEAFLGISQANPIVEAAVACDPSSLNYTQETATLRARIDYAPPISRLGPFTLRSEAVMRCGG
jgi:Flp pilus assembly protein TadG